MKIAVVGGTGQLGSEIADLGPRVGYHTWAFGHEMCEVTTVEGVAEVARYQPDVIVNCAAYHDLSACEENPEQAWAVNEALPLAYLARRMNCGYVYISTDFVFDGREGAYAEDAGARPLSVYGATKLAGELAALTLVERSAVCRVSYLFGKTGCRAKGGSNFVEFLVGAVRDGRHLDLDADTTFSPTYAPHAAARVLDVAVALAEGSNAGVFHCTNEGVASHYGLGLAVAALLGMEADFAPRNGALDPLRPKCSDLANTRMKAAPSWADGLAEYLEAKGYV